MNIAQAIIIAIIEGITEFLPISSTGHMILTEALLRMGSSDFAKTYIVTIQFGAIVSVIVLYWRRFVQSFRFYSLLGIGFLPAALIGFLFGGIIDQLLDNVVVVAIMLIIGGIVLVVCDQWFTTPRNDHISWRTALYIGCFQCCAMIPGVSRSAATIIGGMVFGLSRKQAAEFSFLLAVPTMLAAAGYKILKTPGGFSHHEIIMLIIGNITACLVAGIAIKGFIAYLSNHGFRHFGYYRIALGGVILILMLCGYDLRIV
ncbi:MAG: undecaprenyl-diphosphate phosphatase [Desulfobacterota bacterium]|nr:undecaprenyl-diphosphate phosphatase [Thermodesulfobacteriota bacterium]